MIIQYFVDCFRKSRANNPEGRHSAGSAYVAVKL